MKATWWKIAFAIALIINLVSVQLGNTQLQHYSKPLIVFFLAGYFLYSVNGFKHRPRAIIIIALFFSWVGDILLMFVPENEIYFLLGLSSFLLAHIFYILFFEGLRRSENIRIRISLLLLVCIYYAVLIGWLMPYLGDMKVPVIVYGAVISCMCLLALHMFFISNKGAGLLMLLGALLFVASDSILAIDKFYRHSAWAIMIMITYGIAQLYIIEGAIRYIRKEEVLAV
jgi:uncharacterized membrane protein YhhN